VNPGKIYDFLLHIIHDDFAQRGYGEREIDEEARKILRRVFRGVPGGRHYNTKDGIYFKGEEIAKTLRGGGKLSYAEKTYVDPEMIPLFIDLGIYDILPEKEKLIAGYKEALKDIIKQDDWQKIYLETRRLWQLFGE